MAKIVKPEIKELLARGFRAAGSQYIGGPDHRDGAGPQPLKPPQFWPYDRALPDRAPGRPAAPGIYVTGVPRVHVELAMSELAMVQMIREFQQALGVHEGLLFDSSTLELCSIMESISFSNIERSRHPHTARSRSMIFL